MHESSTSESIASCCCALKIRSKSTFVKAHKLLAAGMLNFTKNTCLFQVRYGRMVVNAASLFYKVQSPKTKDICGNSTHSKKKRYIPELYSRHKSKTLTIQFCFFLRNNAPYKNVSIEWSLITHSFRLNLVLFSNADPNFHCSIP